MSSPVFMLVICAILSLTVTLAHCASLGVTPDRDLPWLHLQHPDLPEPLWVRVPEHIVTLEGLVAQEVEWEQVSESVWRFRWAADESLKSEKQTDFWGEVEAGEDALAFSFTIKNPTTRAWSGKRYNAFDVVAGKLPTFHDPNGDRVYVRVGGRFVSVREAIGDELTPGSASWMLLASDRDHPGFREFTEPLMAKVSDDGEWVLGIASDTANGATFNLDPNTSCIHQNRVWPILRAGEERTLRGKVYILRGGLDDLWKRYEQDRQRWLTTLPDVEALGDQEPAVVRHQPSVWAPPTEPVALRKLWQLRPSELPQHPMATWVADRLARDSGHRPSDAAVSAAVGAFAERDGFWVREDESGLWVSNGLVGLALLPAGQGLGVASLYHLPTQTECMLSYPHTETPWQLIGADDKPLKQVVQDGQSPAVQIAPARGVLALELAWPGEPRVTAQIAMDAGSPLLRWRCRVEPGKEQSAPFAVRFPVLHGVGAPGDNDVVTSWASGRGQLFRAVQGTIWNSGSRYPDSNWSIQHLSISFGQATLYVACHDGAGYTKSFALTPGAELSLTYFPPQTSANAATMPAELPYDIVIGPIAGDWFDAATIYRRWAIKQPWCGGGTLQRRAAEGTIARALIETPFVIRPNWTYDLDDPNARKAMETELHGAAFVNRHREFLGSLPFSVWWYKWQQQRFDDDTPLFDAHEGIADEFRREVAEGLVLTPYTMSLLWDTATPVFDERARAATAKNRDGTMRVQKWYWCEAAEMCMSQQLCQDVTADLAARVAGLGANGVYLDGWPTMRDCWDPSHGHARGLGGTWWHDSIRTILERIKRERGWDFALTGEYFVEPFLGLFDTQMSWWIVEDIDCPLLPAVYSGYAIASGSGTHKSFPDDMNAYRIKWGRPFLWGSQLGRAYGADYLFDEARGAYVKQLVELKARLKDYLVYGTMHRPPRFQTPPPRIYARQWNMQHLGIRSFTYDAVEAALWETPDGQLALLLVNYDDKPHAVSFATKDILAKCDGETSGVRQARTVTATGLSPWRELGIGGMLSLDVPAASALAVEIKP